jgi:hypothetical protein
MKRIVLVALLFFILLITACKQDAQEEVITQNVNSEVTSENAEVNDTAQEDNNSVTKMEQILLKKGSIVKIIDYSESMLPLRFGHATTKIRKVATSNSIWYFLQIIKPSEYNSKTASIVYEDLIEIIEALQTLKQESANDLLLKPEYLENKYISDDGFEIGYYVSKKKLNWFFTLSRYGNENTLFLKRIEDMESLLNSSKIEIEKLQNNN